MDNKCTKCDEPGSVVKLTIDDEDFSSVLGVNLCPDHYDALMECIVEMIYE